MLLRFGQRGSGAQRLLLGSLSGEEFRLLIPQVVLREFCKALSIGDKLRPVHHIFRLALLIEGGARGHVLFPTYDATRSEVEACLHLLPRDPKDVPILLAARYAGASCIITYNTKHFGEQKEFPVETPEAFLSRWSQG